MFALHYLHMLYDLGGMDEEGQRPVKREKGFKLQWLPMLARNEVFRSMNIKERIDKNSSSFQNCVSIFKHLQYIISFKSLSLNVNFEGMTAHFFKEILTEPALKDFEIFRLDNGRIDAKCLDLVMETAQNNRVLHINRTIIPKDYCHKNACKFYDIYYDHAEWVRIEHLLSLKNSYSVSLGCNQLTQQDVNNYIKFWIDNDHDMVQNLSIRTLTVYPTERLIDGIVVLRARFATYLVAANPTKQRKRPILSINWCNGYLSLKSYDKDETFRLRGSAKVESWAPEYKVLQTLNKKKELEGESKEIQKLLETSQDMIEKKNEITRELRNVSQELAGYNLIFRNGVFSKVI